MEYFAFSALHVRRVKHKLLTAHVQNINCVRRMYSYDIFKPLVESNGLTGLGTANADILKRLNVLDTRVVTIEELLSAINNTNLTLTRNIEGFEADNFMASYVRQHSTKEVHSDKVRRLNLDCFTI